MPKVKSPEKHKLILTTAKKLFFSSCYPHVTMSMIADEASISKSTLYKHFTSKDDLLKQVLADHWCSGNIPSINPHDARDVADCLHEFSHDVMNFMYLNDTIAFFRILVSEATHFPDLASAIISQQSGPIQKSLVAFLKEKKLVPDTDTKEAALAYFGLLYTDPFWHMLAGIVPKYTAEAIKTHIDKVIPLYMQTLEQLNNSES